MALITPVLPLTLVSDGSHITEMHNSMYVMYQKGQLCDLVLMSCDDVKFKVHKTIMALSLKYFAQLMEAGKLDGIRDEALKFDDINSIALQQLIDFVYTGRMYLGLETVLQVQSAAVLLGCAPASSLCEEFIRAVPSRTQSTDVYAPACTAVADDQSIDCTDLQPGPSSVELKSLEVQNDCLENLDTSPFKKLKGDALQKVIDGLIAIKNAEHQKPEDDGLESLLGDYTAQSVKEEQQVDPLIQDQTEFDVGQELPDEEDKKPRRRGRPPKRTALQVRLKKPTLSKKPRTEKTFQVEKTEAEELLKADIDAMNKDPAFLDNMDPEQVLKEYSRVVNTGVSVPQKRIGTAATRVYSKPKSHHYACLRFMLKANVASEANRNYSTRKVINKAKPKVFTCSLCGSKFRYLSTLIFHRKYTHFMLNSPTQSLALKLLGKALAFRRYLLSTRDAQKNQTLHCKPCDTKFKFTATYGSHLKHKHQALQCSFHTRRRWSRQTQSCKRRFLGSSAYITHQVRHRCEESEVAERLVCRTHCFGVFKSQALYKRHFLQFPQARPQADGDKDLFPCSECPSTLNSMKALQKHFNKYHQSNTNQSAVLEPTYQFSCFMDDCSFVTVNRYDISKHTKAEHPGLKLECQICSYKTLVAVDLKHHIIKRHFKAKAFKCDFCDKSYRKRSGLVTHRALIHGIGREFLTLYKCEACNFECRQKTNFVKHQSVHDKRKLFECSYCQKKLKSAMTMTKHIKKMHLNIRPYVCEVCGAAFGEESELKSHQNNKHLNLKPFPCHMCSYATSNKNTLRAHMFSQHAAVLDDKTKYYQCDLCPYKTMREIRFTWHMSKHDNIRTYQCDQCDMKFFTPMTMRKHKRWLHGPKAVQCPYCEHKTADRQHLLEHIRLRHTHTDFKPFKCVHCSFRTALRGNCTKHIRQTHKGLPVLIEKDEEMWKQIKASLPKLKDLGSNGSLI